MLSFFRTKSSEAAVDKIIDGTKDIALNVDKSVVDIASCSTNESMSSEQNASSSDLLSSLGYQDEGDLRETIYGMCVFWVCGGFSTNFRVEKTIDLQFRSPHVGS